MKIGKYNFYLTPKHRMADSEEEMCGRISARGAICTREEGHQGPHEAHTRPRIAIERWE